MTEPPDDPYGLAGATLDGRFAVGPAVARGGFGVVYRARQLDLDAPVALKVLAGADALGGEARDEALRRFRDEARTLAALRHPAVARVLSFGVLSRAGAEVPWMAMEWIDGATLDDDLRARAGAGRSPREALDLLRPAFEALACAHEAGVSHRDLKPANLMRTAARRGEPGLRVIDFGLAKVAPAGDGAPSGATETRSEVIAFSPRYAAPEQVGRTRTGPWTDVHALALLVTELVTGAPAYEGDDGPSLLAAIVSATRPTPGRRGVAVGPWEVVLARALAIAPGDRPADAAKLLRELESCVDEADAAWRAAPPALGRPAVSLAATLAPSPDAAVAKPALPAAAPPLASSSPRRTYAAWAIAVVTAIVALGFGLRAATRAAPAPTPLRVTSAPRVDPSAPPSPAPPAPPVVVAAPVAMVEAPTTPAPRRLPRAPVVRRASAPARAGVTQAPPAVAPAAVPFVPIE